MCGIFGQISNRKINSKNLKTIAAHSMQRGVDSSGLIYYKNSTYTVSRADYNIKKLLKRVDTIGSNIVVGHSRLITNGLNDNQPVVRDGMALIHNGIITNEKEAWHNTGLEKRLQIDSELILAIASDHFLNGGSIESASSKILSKCRGVLACALLIPEKGKMILFSNNGSLYIGEFDGDIYFASEKYALTIIGCKKIRQIKNRDYIIDIHQSHKCMVIDDPSTRQENLIPEFSFNKIKESLLEYNVSSDIKRCTRCILPETMPFIKFDDGGVCNYCNKYVSKSISKSKDEILKLVEPYRRPGGEPDCIVPFSGGRDSCYGLHLILNDLEMKPITYTYDWGMVTDLGRRNVSQMCGDMGIENIIVSADISLKRRNITKNLKAWLKSPHLGMMSILTAGDKHFFRHVENIKNQTGINLNLWGINPLETTHFKTGFLGVKPNFEEDKVYSSGAIKQLKYHSKRFKAMTQSPGYFNSSLWDTLSGEYYRSFTKKRDYFHIFDYYQWNEDEVNNTLISEYEWETAIDTSATWRIGDGTAGFYNYVYYTVAGFTEHDTFRSNQIREGQITRKRALELVADENRPRYQNIRWYLDVLGLDFEEVIKVVNSIPKLYLKHE
jgi:glutamine---fructose-6-phosphate transaminase (isomerizing)